MLDLDLMKKLYEFGGLLAFRVQWFDPLTWETKTKPMTFNEQVAKDLVAHLIAEGFKAAYFQEIVKFDGAFASK
jgi:hypothetical protein